ncbi:GNAT family N-acetyltransferase [Fictibacillus sp. KU28468]|uniref:GNAT family N-acetyltransferase n=1 Tax=Fictibacillus sp. KU28468 TaxID=2991053 RepID=UPI00223D3FFD|nr:GNAT family N-acetyltransferase [Fictibacillus sp. KU28468]UZJ78821.1 GNAT family N-acetyltransferase [Fictibacillus sp. KU28468]
MVSIKRLNTLSFQEAADLFNEGFKHYFTDITLTVDSLIKKLANEDLSPEKSVVAFDQEKPVGFVINGFRTVNGQKISWNGGTGIIPEYRGKGIGKEMITACMDIYEEEGVELLLLEAITENTRAIKLYESMGYSIFDELTFLVNNEPLSEGAFYFEGDYDLIHGIPQDVRDIEFYQHMPPWQTQYQSLKDSESLIVKCGQETVGYAVFKRTKNAEGKIEGIALYQCEAKPGYEKAYDVIQFMLRSVYTPAEPACRRMTVNFSKSNKLVCDALSKEGFTVMIEQVHMSKAVRTPSSSEKETKAVQS